ncbi:MAG: hypothetical protein ACLUAR_20095 [Pilosibacter sp.]
MKSINFETGYKEFTINDDPERAIRFNPTDADILQRFRKALDDIRGEKKKLKDVGLKADGTASEDEMFTWSRPAMSWKSLTNSSERNWNYIFNSDVYDAVFAGQSPLAVVGKERKLLVEAFMEAALESSAKKSRKRARTV